MSSLTSASAHTHTTALLSSQPARRYAVAYAPNPGSLGWLAGSHWLGRCAALLQPLRQLDIEGVDPEDLRRLTAVPRQQGWRAPLVAPFALAHGADWMALQQAVQALAQSLKPLVLPPLQVERVGGVLALVLPASHAANGALQHIAAACEARLRPLAEPLPSAPEMAGPQAARPPFRFHMPITGPLSVVDEATQTRVFDVAVEYFSDLPVLRFNSLALFEQSEPGTDFVLLDHLEMGA